VQGSGLCMESSRVQGSARVQGSGLCTESSRVQGSAWVQGSGLCTETVKTVRVRCSIPARVSEAITSSTPARGESGGTRDGERGGGPGLVRFDPCLEQDGARAGEVRSSSGTGVEPGERERIVAVAEARSSRGATVNGQWRAAAGFVVEGGDEYLQITGR
jgi:hypothetical protein